MSNFANKLPKCDRKGWIFFKKRYREDTNLVRVKAASGPSTKASGVRGQLRRGRLRIRAEAAERSGLRIEAAPACRRR